MSEPVPELLIFIGLYEEDLVVYRVVADKKDPGRLALEFLLLDRIQRGAIKVLTSHGNVLASAGADGRVSVIDLEDRIFWNVVLPEEETINDLAFSGCGEYLFVAGFERNLYYVGVREQRIVCRKGNVSKTPVVVVRVRPPTGRDMFTMEQDRVMRHWDLHGSSTRSTDVFKKDQRFEGPILCMEFSPSGDRLAVAGWNFVKVNSLAEGTEVRAVNIYGKPVAIVWLSETVLVIGIYSGKLVTFRTDNHQEPDVTRIYDDSKLKAMARVGQYLATVSNASVLILWEILDRYQFGPLCQTTVAGHATSMVMMKATEVREFVAEVCKAKEEAAKNPEMYDFDPSDDEDAELESVPGCSKQMATVELNASGDTSPEAVPGCSKQATSEELRNNNLENTTLEDVPGCSTQLVSTVLRNTSHDDAPPVTPVHISPNKTQEDIPECSPEVCNSQEVPEQESVTGCSTLTSLVDLNNALGNTTLEAVPGRSKQATSEELRNNTECPIQSPENISGCSTQASPVDLMDNTFGDTPDDLRNNSHEDNPPEDTSPTQEDVPGCPTQTSSSEKCKPKEGPPSEQEPVPRSSTKVFPVDLMNNTFGDSLPDNDSIEFVGTEQLDLESEEEQGEYEEEDLYGDAEVPKLDQVIPETPSKESLIDPPPANSLESSMESLRVSSDEQFKSSADRPPTPIPPKHLLDFYNDDDDDYSDTSDLEDLPSAGTDLEESYLMRTFLDGIERNLNNDGALGEKDSDEEDGEERSAEGEPMESLNVETAGDVGENVVDPPKAVEEEGPAKEPQNVFWV